MNDKNEYLIKDIFVSNYLVVFIFITLASPPPGDNKHISIKLSFE